MDKILEAILMEADKVKVDSSPDKINESKKEERRSTDYTMNEDEVVDADDSNQQDEEDDSAESTDYTQDAPTEDEPDETSTSDDTNDQQNDEETENTDENEDDSDNEDADDQGTDYTDLDAENADTGDEGGEDDTDTDDTSTDTGDSSGNTPESDEQIKERHLKTKQLTLMNQMIGLHSNINSYIEQLNGVERTNVFVSSIISTVSDNFTKLKEVIYKYIMYYFNNMSYEYNLYTFNYFIEAIKVNIELLAKIKDAQNYDSETSK